MYYQEATCRCTTAFHEAKSLAYRDFFEVAFGSLSGKAKRILEDSLDISRFLKEQEASVVK